MVNMKHQIYFNDIPLPSFVIVKQINTQILADITNTTVKGVVGYRHKKIEFGSKLITIDFSLERDGVLSKFEQQQELIQWLKGDDWKESKLILPDNPNLYYMAICNNGFDLDYSDIEGEGTIEFLICDPHRYGIQNIDIKLSDINKYDMQLGTEYSYPKIIFDITSDCEELKLTLKNKKYDNYIRFKHNFLTNDKLIIDMKTKKITLNGETKMQILTLDSRYHMIDPNILSNEYNFEIGNADITLEAQEVYL